MSDTPAELCYEYFDCKEYNCVRRQMHTVNCWDIDDVRCETHSKEFEKIKLKFKTKLEACKFCSYYQAYHHDVS